jgi:hypothetical protein
MQRKSSSTGGSQDPPATGPGDAAERDEAMRALVTRLARPHASGGHVIERASLLAEGHDLAAALAWIEAHGGRPEELPVKAGGGLHGTRQGPSAARVPLRFVLPPAALR